MEADTVSAEMMDATSICVTHRQKKKRHSQIPHPKPQPSSHFFSLMFPPVIYHRGTGDVLHVVVA